MSIILESLKKEFQEDIKKASKFFRNITLAQTGVLLIVCILGVKFIFNEIGHRKVQQKSIDSIASDISLLMRNLEEINEPIIVLKIVKEKCPYMSAELQVQTANSIYQTAKLRGIPMAIALSVPEQETMWDFRIDNKESGATGGFQVLPSTAQPYMNLLFGGYTKEKLRFPPTNSMIGINLLANNMDAQLELGKSKEQSLLIALGQYRWGYDIKDNGYALSILNKSKKYEERFKTSLKELQSNKE